MNERFSYQGMVTTDDSKVIKEHGKPPYMIDKIIYDEGIPVTLVLVVENGDKAQLPADKFRNYEFRGQAA
ncbi:MAG: hypothetical protein UY41_C0011G0002 [Candidatus Moranbacteria bacterium GW2011_GWE1_49_15]|nr:MAG: hypothetical protein UX75_C0030G0002 [Candidatus Moranbacteria bacterium GW2011_GWE2_47_10]KKW06945.1 MAG: hypothetical protein UY41_C0011G0002 [Candidatus Moranbacteria bacterium GW2011_GWE1_49_15]HBP01412.1 hypothetical protein [Candidatus Moranbacteria bacterium]